MLLQLLAFHEFVQESLNKKQNAIGPAKSLKSEQLKIQNCINSKTCLFYCLKII